MIFVCPLIVMPYYLSMRSAMSEAMNIIYTKSWQKIVEIVFRGGYGAYDSELNEEDEKTLHVNINRVPKVFEYCGRDRVSFSSGDPVYFANFGGMLKSRRPKLGYGKIEDDSLVFSCNAAFVNNLLHSYHPALALLHSQGVVHYKQLSPVSFRIFVSDSDYFFNDDHYFQ